jgi:hydroxymethylbilane synthase
MLPAPAQGAIVVQARDNDDYSIEACGLLNDQDTATCTFVEREFLRALLGGCSTPISTHAVIEGEEIIFRGNILSADGSRRIEVEKILPVSISKELGREAARELLNNGGWEIIESLTHARK